MSDSPVQQLRLRDEESRTVDELLKRLKGILPENGYEEIERLMTIDPLSNEVKKLLKNFYSMYQALIARDASFDNLEYIGRMRHVVEVWIRMYVTYFPQVVIDDEDSEQ